jgi:hypothetical protein
MGYIKLMHVEKSKSTASVMDEWVYTNISWVNLILVCTA